MSTALANKETAKEIFLKDNKDIKVVDMKDLSLRSMLDMIDDRSKRDSEVLSVVCDDQANQ